MRAQLAGLFREPLHDVLWADAERALRLCVPRRNSSLVRSTINNRLVVRRLPLCAVPSRHIRNSEDGHQINLVAFG